MSEPTGAAVAEKPKVQTDDPRCEAPQHDDSSGTGWIQQLDLSRKADQTVRHFANAQHRGIDRFVSRVSSPARLPEPDYFAVALDLVFKTLLSSVAGKLGTMAGEHVVKLLKNHSVSDEMAEQIKTLAVGLSKQTVTHIVKQSVGKGLPATLTAHAALLPQFAAEQRVRVDQAELSSSRYINGLAAAFQEPQAKAALIAVANAFESDAAVEAVRADQRDASTNAWLDLVAKANSPHREPGAPVLDAANPDAMDVRGPIDVYASFTPGTTPADDEVSIDRCTSKADRGLLEVMQDQPIGDSRAPLRFHVTTPSGETIHFGRNTDGVLRVISHDLSSVHAAQLGRGPDLPSTPDGGVQRGLHRLNLLLNRHTLDFQAGGERQ